LAPQLCGANFTSIFPVTLGEARYNPQLLPSALCDASLIVSAFWNRYVHRYFCVVGYFYVRHQQAFDIGDIVMFAFGLQHITALLSLRLSLRGFSRNSA
jgi:hypothetical protein